jgi:predicted AlkP superfamily pyrophosphatase or phosphodiesterase
LDKLAHDYGPTTEQADAEFRSIDRLLADEFLAFLPPEDREGTLLLITADHGQIHIPTDHIVTAREHPELSRHLTVPVVGESRAAFLYPRPGRAGAIRRYLSEAFPGWFVTLESAKALEAGLLGQPIYDESRARLGELLILPTGQHALQHSKPPFSLIGRHGGLTQEEMLVPLLGARLDA